MFDAHTHCLRRNALVCIDPVSLREAAACGCTVPALKAGYRYSVGIHPWNVLAVTPADIRLLRALAADPRVLAIGECGLDTHKIPRLLNQPPFQPTCILEAQTALLGLHFALSETLGKPLILHIVKAFPEIIRLKKQWRPSQPWIIHGFRGKPQLARELLAHGFYLSYGRKYNPDSLALTPASRLLRETDDMPC